MIDTRSLVDRLATIESVAIIARVSSTNLVARRVVSECIENELSLPHAMIVAREQLAGRGRNERTWSSPAGKGIYASTLLSVKTSELGHLSLRMANVVAGYLGEVFGIDARVKWPNDVLVGGRKIAGILLESRLQNDHAFVVIGMGINVEPVVDEGRPNAVAISELAPKGFRDLEGATVDFIEYVDRELSKRVTPGQILAEWRARTVHKEGDRITCALGDRTFAAIWKGIDEDGRAILEEDGEIVTVSSGDLFI